MTDVLFKAFSFLAVIIIGYLLKKKGVFKEEDTKLIAEIALNITLPASVISSFASFEKNNMLFILMLIGLFANLFMSLIAFIASMRKSRGIKILYMMNCPGYNIGSFCLPFIQGFIGPDGVVSACMFDTGNALMTCGGNYALTCAAAGNENNSKFGIRDFLLKMITSIPFDTYIVAFLLTVFDIRLPHAIVNLLSTTASANGFMAMLMLGLSLDFDIEKEYMNEIIKLLILKYGISAILACAVYFLLPLPLILKNVLAIIMFSPTSALVPAFTQKCGGNVKASGFLASVSIVISVIIITVLITIMQ
jgi:predicted permease